MQLECIMLDRSNELCEQVANLRFREWGTGALLHKLERVTAGGERHRHDG